MRLYQPVNNGEMLVISKFNLPERRILTDENIEIPFLLNTFVL
jgi:hypothetical protein